MPYFGASLAQFVRDVAEVTPPAARSMAARGGRTLTFHTREGTPIGPGTDYGHVRDPWQEKPVEHERSGGIDRYRTGVDSHHYRAPWIEWGTQPHRIEPKNSEALDTPQGARGGVDHPGARAFHPVARAVFILETELDAVMAPELSAWAKAAEQNARRRPGIR